MSPKILPVSFNASSPLAHMAFPRAHHRKNSTASIISNKSFSSIEGGLAVEGVGHHATDHGKEGEHRFLGTPDYLAPECILGAGQEPTVDWVSIF
jgi:hypothetical protein